LSRSPVLSASVNEHGEEKDGKHADDANFPSGHVRAGFLRFQTSVLRSYRSYIIAENIEHGMSTTEMFDKDRFVQSFPEASQETMDRLIRSQAWSAFLQERTSAPWEEGTSSVASDAVRYFDEQIIAKMNRSMLSRKKATLFLDDTRWEVLDYFTAPLPSMQRLPSSHDDRYTCDLGQFPVQFRGDAWFGPVRKPRQLTVAERSRTASGEMREALMRIQTQAHLNVGRRVSTSDFAGDQFVEDADGMTIVDLVSTAGASTRRSSRVMSSDSLRDFDLDAWGDGGDGGGSGSRNGGGGSGKKDGFANRRASDYANTQKLVIRVQARWRSYLAKKHVREKMRCFRARRERNAARIQHVWRRRQQFKRCVRLLQAMARQRVMRQWYLGLRSAATIVQTWARGWQCRHQAIADRRARILELRADIRRGWDATAVPLLKRSRFWLSLNTEHPSYLDLGVHLDEVQWIEERRGQFGMDESGTAPRSVVVAGESKQQQQQQQHEATHHRREKQQQ
jgi:hypothetical protein